MFENELDKLRAMMDEAGIPYENFQVEYTDKEKEIMGDYFKSYGNEYKRNQIIYGRYEDGSNNWKFDGICQTGSYGAKEGLIETYGDLGVDAEGDPLVMNAAEAFEIISQDWKKQNEPIIGQTYYDIENNKWYEYKEYGWKEIECEL